MKKVFKLVLMAALCLSFGFVLTGCGSSNPYSSYDLSEYITLPDYNAYESGVPEVNVTDADIEKEITARLEKAKTTQKITEGTVAEGDTVTVAFEGELADGTKDENMNSDGYDLKLGAGGMIDGFESGLYGATIGEEVTLNLTFPDPYESKEEYSGKDVTFKVTVLSKNVEVIPELNEEFVKANSSYQTVDEYRAGVAKELEQAAYDEQLYSLKYEIYSKMVSETEVLKYPEKEVKKQTKELRESYEQMAKNSGVEWDAYLSDTLKVDQETFDKKIEEYAQELVKQEMIIYAVADKEGLTVTDEEYDAYLNSMLEASEFKDEAAFKEYTGMSLKKYAKKYKMDRDLLLTKELDTIYERLTAEESE